MLFKEEHDSNALFRFTFRMKEIFASGEFKEINNDIYANHSDYNFKDLKDSRKKM